MIVLISFWLLASLTFLLQRERAAAMQRRPAEWTLDTLGLLVQGLAVPALQITLIYGLLNLIAPAAKASLDLSPLLAFLLNFVAVDYLYYWNHRALHTQAFWKTHAVHHTPEQADVFITSRNTLWTPLLIVYVWVNGLMLFLLKDPVPFLLSASITASLDLWRHTTFITVPGSPFHRVLALLFITPNEHLWHHSRERAGCNFGANLSLWDRLHGTYYSPAARPVRLGIPVRLALPRKLLFPFRAANEEPPQ
jgi:sterol desaturase/sphingolipid hydroxylase (fatty acid hydroxylase superfamily)